MATPSQIVLLGEDSRHQRFLYKYLQRLGFQRHEIRVRMSPAGAGSAEQWVRSQFPVEVESCRRRQAETRLIVVIDADNHSVADRLAQLDHSMQTAGLPIANETPEIVRLVPKRNIETWILCLNDQRVNEDQDYKDHGNDWTQFIQLGTEKLYSWTRPNAVLPAPCVDSLRKAVSELQKLG